MKSMGRYCKAYPVRRLREFPEWRENLKNLRKTQEGEGPSHLLDTDHLYMQEDFTVTDGIFKEEHVIFDAVTAEWIDFCKNVLRFEAPVYEREDVMECEQ